MAGSNAMPAPISVTGTDSAFSADRELATLFDAEEMEIIRQHVEKLRPGQAGAHTYAQAIVELGWAHQLFTRMARRRAAIESAQEVISAAIGS